MSKANTSNKQPAKTKKPRNEGNQDPKSDFVYTSADEKDILRVKKIFTKFSKKMKEEK